MNKIIFIPQHPMCGKEIDSPKPAAHSVEQWYKDAPKFARRDGSPGTLEEAKKRKSFATFKNCVSFFDIMTAGYTFDTVCDIKVFKDKDGKTNLELSKGYEVFAGKRGLTKDFVEPEGYEEDHFYWYPPWSVKLPKGYSALYINPSNRTELPFMSFEGIIDNDKLNITGQYPFLIKKGFEGIIPKGTPYMQIIPFKREDWESEVEKKTPAEIELFQTRGNFKYRKNKVNYYRDNEWNRKKFK